MKKEKEFRWNVIKSEEYYLKVNNEDEFKKELINWIEENGSLNLDDFEEFNSVDTGIVHDPNEDDNAEYEYKEILKELFLFIKEKFDINVKDIID